VLAWKFLRPGAVGPFSRLAWPLPEDGEAGRWVGSGGRDVALCLGGVHACRVGDLPLWIAAELWRIELDGPIVEGETKVVGSAGRLVARVAAWDADVALECSGAAARGVRQLATRRAGEPAFDGYAGDAQTYGLGPGAQRSPFRAAAVAGFIAAQAARAAGGPAAEHAERARQSTWLASRLGLV
jgi:hypothetical protein